MDDQIPPSSKQEKSGVLALATLLLGSGVLLSFFLWILFLSPTGQSKPVLIDFTSATTENYPRMHQSRLPVFRVAIASMVSPEDTFDVYGDLVQYVTGRLRSDPKIIQKMTYREINDLILAGKIELGFICTGAYLQLMKHDIRALVVPVVHGMNYYRAYLIVPRKSSCTGFFDLKGKVFAFTDPDSLTGFLYPNALLKGTGETTETFFARTFFTYSHSDSIHAVSNDLADGAWVNSTVYDFYQKRKPEKTMESRIIAASGPLGMPPVVVGPKVPESERSRLREIFLNMHQDPFGKAILEKMDIDYFIPAEDVLDLYEKTLVLISSDN